MGGPENPRTRSALQPHTRAASPASRVRPWPPDHWGPVAHSRPAGGGFNDVLEGNENVQNYKEEVPLLREKQSFMEISFSPFVRLHELVLNKQKGRRRGSGQGWPHAPHLLRGEPHLRPRPLAHRAQRVLPPRPGLLASHPLATFKRATRRFEAQAPGHRGRPGTRLSHGTSCCSLVG